MLSAKRELREQSKIRQEPCSILLREYVPTKWLLASSTMLVTAGVRERSGLIRGYDRGAFACTE